VVSVARRRRQELYPAPLREFHEEDWPPVAGECLGGYACRAWGYIEDCRPREHEVCGERSYQHLRDTYPPDRAEVMVAAWRRADAAYRFHRARLSWLGDDHPGSLDEFLEAHHHEHELRYSYVPPREPLPAAAEDV
jgi:hypothetical protein